MANGSGQHNTAQLKCPFCLHQDNKTIDTRDTKMRMGLKRRRLCNNCEKPFNTIEIPFDFLKHRLDTNLPTIDDFVNCLQEMMGKIK